MRFKAHKAIIGLLIILTIFMNFIIPAAAQQPSAADIPVSSMIIGSFLIDFSALDEEVYKLAVKSADDNTQPKVYYKSEFANGTWFDITNGESLDSVLAGKGKVVSNSEIDALQLTHWAQSKGVIIDLRTGQAVDINSIDTSIHQSILDFDELENLKVERKVLEKQDESDERSFAIAAIDEIFKPLASPGYIAAKTQLDIIAKYIEHVKADIQNNRDELVELLIPIKDQIKLNYEIQAYTEVKSRTDMYRDLSKNLEYYDISSKLVEVSATFEKTLTELKNSVENEPQELMANEQWILKDKMLGEVFKESFKTADPLLMKMFTVNVIAKGRIIDKEYELSVLREIKEKVVKNLLGKLDIIDSDKYKEALKKGEADVVLKAIKKEELSEISDIIGQVKYLNEQIQKRLDDVAQQMELLEGDRTAFGKQAAKMSEALQAEKLALINEFLNELRDSLNKMKVEQQQKDNSQKELIDKLQNDIKDLKDKYLACMENGDLEGADEIEKQTAELSEQLQAVQQDIMSRIAELNSEKAALEKQIDDALKSGNLGAIDELRSKTDEIDVKLLELEDMLPEDVKSLLDNYELLKQQLIQQLEDKDVDGAEKSLEDIKTICGFAPDDVRGMLKDTDSLNAVEKLINDMIDTALSNKDTAGVQQLNSLLDLAKQVFADVTKTSEDENKEMLLQKIKELTGENGEDGAKLEELEAKSDQLKQTLLNVIDSANAGELKEILAELTDTLEQIMQYKENSLFEQLAAARQLQEQNSDNPDMLEALNGVMEDIATEIKAVERQRYTSEELDILDKIAADIKSSNKDIATLPVESILGENMAFKLYDPPVMKNGDILIAARSVYEFFGAKVTWEDSSRKAFISIGDKNIILQVGNSDAYINGEAVKLSNCAEIINGRTYAPLSFVITSMGYGYEWMEESKLAIIKR